MKWSSHNSSSNGEESAILTEMRAMNLNLSANFRPAWLVLMSLPVERAFENDMLTFREDEVSLIQMAMPDA
jgi:hypothetical protein